MQQLSLFRIGLKKALAQLSISDDDLLRWHGKGWISFGPSPEMVIDERGVEINELTFVRDVVRSGLSDAQICHLFSLLPKPFTFTPSQISFSFMYGWVISFPEEEPGEVIEEHLSPWLEALAQAGDEERLRELKSDIEELLEKI